MPEDILRDLEKEPFEADRVIPEKSSNRLTVERVESTYQGLKNTNFLQSASQVLKRYLRGIGHILPYYSDKQTGRIIDYVPNPELRFRPGSMQPEYLNVKGEPRKVVNALEIYDDGLVKVNYDMTVNDPDTVEILTAHEYLHKSIQEITGENVGSHREKGYESLIPSVLTTTYRLFGNESKANKTSSLTV